MDGMLFVVFFFPAVLTLCIFLSMMSFVVALWVGFGEEIVEMGAPLLGKELSTFLDDMGVLSIIANAPWKDSYLYPLLFNCINIVTVFVTYSLGGIVNRKRGWRFVQPGEGGIRFILLQAWTWVSLAFSLMLPWLAFEDLGGLNLLDLVPPPTEALHEHGGLLVAGAALGTLAELFAFIGLVSYDPSLPESTLTGPKRTPSTPRNRVHAKMKELEVGKINVNMVLGDHKIWWWLFMALQMAIVFNSFSLTVLTEVKLRNNVIQALLLSVFFLMLVTATTLTNSVGGKWRHGERSYFLMMPFQGGIAFSVLQGFGWSTFAAALLLISGRLCSLMGLSFEPVHSLAQPSVVVAGGLGFLSEIFLACSLLVFDKTKVGYPNAKRDQSGGRMGAQGKPDAVRGGAGNPSEPTESSKCAEYEAPGRAKCYATIDKLIGMRSSPHVAGEVEYLVHWRSSDGDTSWVLKSELMVAHGGEQAIEEYTEVHRRMREDQSKSTKRGATRRVKPSRRRSRSRRRKQEPPVTEDVEEKEEPDAPVVEEEDSDARRVVATAKQSKSPRSNNSLLEEWEECEDENGNVFYYNIATKESTNVAPVGLVAMG